jgi:hypothetical protein
MRRLIRGATAGALATALMSSVMVGAQQVGLMGGMPPEKITAKLLNRGGIRRSSEQQDALATLLHFGFGAAAGAGFGLLAPRRLIARVPRGRGVRSGNLGRELPWHGCRRSASWPLPIAIAGTGRL